MTLTAKSEGNNFEPTPAGVHQGVCIWVIDLGTQHNETFDVWQSKVYIGWELPHERIEIDGNNKPRMISKIYTLSLNEKANLRKDLESWRGRGFTQDELEGFDLTKLLSANCLLNVIHKPKGDRTYTEVAGIMPLSKNMAKIEPENKPTFWDMDKGEPIPQDLPDWLKNLIYKSREWSEGGQQDEGPPPDWEPPIEEDDIPF